MTTSNDERLILVGQIMVNRPDFKIGYLFNYNNQWYAVKKGGDLEFVCLRRNGNQLEGVDPNKQPSPKDFFHAVNYNIYHVDGTPIE